MRVHAIVDDLETARRAVAAGATVVQLRVKAPTGAVVERGHGFTELGVTFVVNDDVEAAILLDADDQPAALELGEHCELTRVRELRQPPSSRPDRLPPG